MTTNTTMSIDEDAKLIIRVKCPHCDHEQNATTIFRVRCFHCNRTYEVYPLDPKGHVLKSRIVGIVKGTKEELHKLAYRKLRQNNGGEKNE